MESDTTDLHGFTQANHEPDPEPMELDIPEPMEPMEKMKAWWMRSLAKNVKEYLNQSPYDAMIAPTNGPFGGNSVFPIYIEEERPMLENFSQLALEYYNNINKEGSGQTFEFVDLVKCAMWVDSCTNAFCGFVPTLPTEYYITFEAKTKNSPAIKIFQAKVLVDIVDNDKPPVVEECHIKPHVFSVLPSIRSYADFNNKRT